MANEHIGDRAELFALGAVDENENVTIERHLRGCLSCAQLVGSAERDIALIASMESRREAPSELAGRIDYVLQVNRASASARRDRRPWLPAAALAAALVLGLLPSAYFWSQSRILHDEMAAQSAAMARIAAEPHRTARFRTMHENAPAEVVYAMDGSWYVVVVRGASKALSVAWMHGGERTMLGKTASRGDLAMLYLPNSHRMDRLALMDGDRVIAEATLSWQRTLPSRQGGRSG